MNIAISGASGYLGQRIKNELLLKNFNVISLCRNAENKNELNFHLGKKTVDSTKFKKNKIKVLIHCAWDLSNLNEKESHKINVIGSKKLLNQAIKGGVKKIIFISSMSAFDGCKSIYGKSKVEVENYFLKKDAVIIRPGLIWSDENPGGMFKKINTAVNNILIIPIINHSYLYLVHEKDLIQFVIQEAKNIRNIKKVYSAAFPEAILFKEIIKECARRNQRKLILVPLFWLMLWIPLKLIEILGVRFQFKLDNLIGLIRSNPNPIFPIDAEKKFRPFN